jgi:tetraacyldisaccharide 4'-kinase
VKPPTHPAAQAALAFPSWLYGRGVALRNRFYDRPGAATRGAIPTISVGNITAGGTGKTPTVAWVAKQLLADGIRPSVVSRGYGGTAGKGPRTVTDGATLQCTAAECGDEPYLLAGLLPGVPIIVGSDRIAGVQAASDLGATVAILDDGFQHRRLQRDLDIVLVDATNPFGNSRLLPAGILREPLSGLSRAGLIMITRAKPGEAFATIEHVVRQYNDHAPILLAGHRGVGYRNLAGEDVPRPERAVVFCGIGNPDRFRNDLEADGIEVMEFHAERDHHRYTSDQIATLSRRASELGALLVTTEKDVARLEPATTRAAEIEIVALRIEADIYDPAPLVDLLRDVASRTAA